jgi:hypothetical protein
MAAPHVAGLLALGGTNCVGTNGTANGDPDGDGDDIAFLNGACLPPLP